MFSEMKTENKGSIWVKINKELSGEENDIFIGTYYIRPLRGKEDVLCFQRMGNVIINGDFNAKTSNEDDFITPDKHDDNTESYYRETPGKRKYLLDMCKGQQVMSSVT